MLRLLGPKTLLYKAVGPKDLFLRLLGLKTLLSKAFGALLMRRVPETPTRPPALR